MSKIEIINTYKRNNKEEILNDNYFYDRLSFINKNNINNEEIYQNIGYEGYGSLLILPDGYFPLFSDELNYTFIADSNNVLYKIIYYPGLDKNQDNPNETTFIERMPKQKIYLEREYVLEKSSFLTEEKYGENNPYQLLSALQEVQNGFYNKFTNRDHGREDLKQVPPEEIPQLMRQILYKYDIINKNDYITDTEVRNFFVVYIKRKVFDKLKKDQEKKIEEEKKDELEKKLLLSLTDLLTNAES